MRVMGPPVQEHGDRGAPRRASSTALGDARLETRTASSATCTAAGQCEQDLRICLDALVARFGAQVLGAYDLPDLEDASLERGDLRAVAALWWCAMMEEAGLPGFVEGLVTRLEQGEALDVGYSEEALWRYWRGRAFRHVPAERRAIYSRLFGGPGSTSPNHAFPAAWRALLDALIDAAGDGPHPRPHRAWQAGAAAMALCRVLAPRCGGGLLFDADRLVDHVHQALQLLESPGLKQALGGLSPLECIRVHSRPVLGRAIDPCPWVDRARGGAAVLRWLADQRPRHASSGWRLEPDETVLGAVALLGRSTE
jgi:hypothetical protein